ncbi:organic hydroperoxide resistance protein [Chitinophaga silvisoli]|uniref:Organic hydroperoxide resistance protein n=1 Tax=Chitinophaga silvisoli TaxID=2291814 RepID=A0A3E1NW64_9BACT|nr:organic hydroperoxide resistance protein [Chitinophaga silvisoli]RFM32156.1 organic hydroperoxide resistance protein [Chitinophaga silvisoli]
MQQINVFASTPIVIKKVLYTGRVHVSGGREGYAKSDDGRLQTALTAPGSKGPGTNPEQLLAAGWSACFIGAMQHNAASMGFTLPADLSIDTDIALTTGDNGFHLLAHLQINLPGFSEEAAKQIVAAAHETCPYSKATSGNINVSIDVSI